MRVKDKVVIVTGGASGIGSHYTRGLIAEGAKVVIADINLEAGQALAAELNEGSDTPSVLAIRTDVTSETDTLAMAESALSTFGKIDILINNAGVYPHVEWEDISYEKWRTVMSINLDGTFLCCRAVVPHMREQKSGRIINIATDLVWVGLVGMVHYVASKSGVIGFTYSLARELGPDNIRVNAIAPGPVIPPGNHTGVNAQRIASIIGQQAVKREQTAKDLVGPLLFLCSSDADFISAQILNVDGGLTTH